MCLMHTTHIYIYTTGPLGTPYSALFGPRQKLQQQRRLEKSVAWSDGRVVTIRAPKNGRKIQVKDLDL